jgi:hypothetical protein
MLLLRIQHDCRPLICLYLTEGKEIDTVYGGVEMSMPLETDKQTQATHR